MHRISKFLYFKESKGKQKPFLNSELPCRFRVYEKPSCPLRLGM